MSGRTLQVLFAAASIERPGAETLVVRESGGKQRLRGYEGRPAEAGEAFDPTPLTHWFSIEKAAEVAAKLLRGDPQACGDTRVTLLVAAALLAIAGPPIKPPRDVSVTEPTRASELL